jgi:hypothetical protein
MAATTAVTAAAVNTLLMPSAHAITCTLQFDMHPTMVQYCFVIMSQQAANTCVTSNAQQGRRGLGGQAQLHLSYQQAAR